MHSLMDFFYLQGYFYRYKRSKDMKQIPRKMNNLPQVSVFDVFHKMVQHFEDVE
jgi:hypothetical protein